MKDKLTKKEIGYRKGAIRRRINHLKKNGCPEDNPIMQLNLRLLARLEALVPCDEVANHEAADCFETTTDAGTMRLGMYKR